MAQAWRVEQNFYTNREKLFVEKQLFADGEFPCPEAEEGSPCMWVRPPTLINSPVFLKGIGRPRNVRSGKMSCSCLPVVLDVLQRRPSLWSYVVAQDQSYDQDYAGMFLFRFWRGNKLEPIVVDDILPFDVDSKTFMLTTHTNAPDMWCVLLEKAYAKFLGGYDRLKTVTVGEAISDILGSTVQLYHPEFMGATAKLFKVFKTIFEFDNIAIAEVRITAAAIQVFRQEYLHSLYIVTSMQRGQDVNGKDVWIITLWQPWSDPGIDNEVTDIPSATFTVTFKEFTKLFSLLHVGISRFPNLFSPISSQSHWNTLAISGKWARCGKRDPEHVSYPCARIQVNQADSFGEGKLSTMVLSLLQSHGTSAAKAASVVKMRVTVYGLIGTERLHKKLPLNKLALSQPVLKTDMHASREITLHMCLEPGQYLIMPETDDCVCRTQSRYLLTLYSVEPLTLLNGGIQKYGDEFLTPVTLTVTACDYVAVGQPIRIAAKITDFPSQTRFTMSMLLMLNRTSESAETPIKARLEYVEVCQGLMDKELFMWVSYHEYVKFPLQGEGFIARCSAFIHELSVDVKAHKEVSTVLPKVKMATDRRVLTGRPTLVTVMLHNTLPLTIPSARFRMFCSSKNSHSWITGSPYDVPPFGTLWIICRLKASQPRCHHVKVYFLSNAFKRTAWLSVQVQNVDGFTLDTCPIVKTRLLGQDDSFVTDHGEPCMVSCCVKHTQVNVDTVFPLQSLKPSWYAINQEYKPNEVTEEAPEDIFYCTPALMRDTTPVAELPSLGENESEMSNA